MGVAAGESHSVPVKQQAAAQEGAAQPAPVPLYARIALLGVLVVLGLQEDMFLRLLRPSSQAHLSLVSSSAAPPRFAGPPFCPGRTSALCDGEGGEISVGVPAWALEGPPPPAREMAALPDPRQWQWKSQYGECGFASREFFFGLEGGVIVESGALDGLMFSTSWGFVKSYGWRAVHIEANPENFAQLVKNRPEAININAGLCSADLQLHYISDGVVKAAGLTRHFKDLDPSGLTPVSGFWEFMSPALRERWWGGVTDEQARALPATPCRALSHLLPLFGITHVHLWILDVEGAELSVLEGFDFTAVRVDVVGIELDGSNGGKDEACRAALRRAGFELHRRGHPYAYRDRGEEPQRENSGPSILGGDNEWWINTGSGAFDIRYEAMERYGRGDKGWTPASEQWATEYRDATPCCYSRDPEPSEAASARSAAGGVRG